VQTAFLCEFLTCRCLRLPVPSTRAVAVLTILKDNCVFHVSVLSNNAADMHSADTWFKSEMAHGLFSGFPQSQQSNTVTCLAVGHSREECFVLPFTVKKPTD
jgi:hypothetical protein